MQIKNWRRTFLSTLLTILLTWFLTNTVAAQHPTNYLRIAKIVIDPVQLENYKTAVKAIAAASVEKEAGVLTLYAVYEKNNPTHVTVFEIYADEEAYKLHTETTHFKQYKTTVKQMVQSLELIDVVPIALEAKGKYPPHGVGRE